MQTMHWIKNFNYSPPVKLAGVDILDVYCDIHCMIVLYGIVNDDTRKC